MSLERVRKVGYVVKLLLAAGWGYLFLPTTGGVIIAFVWAIWLLASYPLPFKTFKECLCVNWRGYSLLAALLAAIVVLFLGNVEASAVVNGFSACGLGVICGEYIQSFLQGFVKASGES
jgi:hypothetical protein